MGKNMDTFTIDYSSLPLDQFYYMKVALKDSVSHMTMAFIYRFMDFNPESSMCEGYIEGLPFVLLHTSYHSNLFKSKGIFSYRYLISTSSIQTMRLLDKKEGPLVINWKHISSDLKTFLFG
jgi:hypothetical protein